MIFLIFFILLFTAYSGLILFFWRSWITIPVPHLENDIQHTTLISVIVAARNEEANIGNLLQALENQTYPKHLFEIIVIDDHSSDGTADIALQFQHVKLLRLENDAINSYKKKAIEKGIAAASNDLIVTTDADCVPPPGWLETIASFQVLTNAGFIVAPVSFSCSPKVVEMFQAMYFLVL